MMPQDPPSAGGGVRQNDGPALLIAGDLADGGGVHSVPLQILHQKAAAPAVAAHRQQLAGDSLPPGGRQGGAYLAAPLEATAFHKGGAVFCGHFGQRDQLVIPKDVDTHDLCVIHKNTPIR